MDFCPKCGTRLTLPKKVKGRKGALLLSCHRCGYKNRATQPNSFLDKVKNHPLENLIIIGKKEYQLRTSPKLMILCPKCGNKKAYAWIVHLGSLAQSSTQFFRCTKCNYTFRDTQ